MIDGLLVFNLDHFPDSVHHTPTDPAVLAQLKEKEQMSGGEVWGGGGQTSRVLERNIREILASAKTGYLYLFVCSVGEIRENSPTRKQTAYEHL